MSEFTSNMSSHSRMRGRRLGPWLAMIALLLATAASLPAEAATNGDDVLLTRVDGSLMRGRLVDQTPQGYLLAVDGKSVLVPYAEVSRIEVMGAGRPPARAATARTAPTAAPIAGHVPPRPRIPGSGKMVAGWIMFGVGTVFAIVGAVAYEDSVRCDFDLFDGGCSADEEFLALSYLGGAVGTAGLVIAIVGHVQKGIARGRLRRWEQQYGRGATLWHDDTGRSMTLDPMPARTGAQGLALTLSF